MEEGHTYDTGGSEAMSLMTLSVQDGHTFDEARTRLETAVHEVTRQCGTLIQRVEWSTDRSQVRLEGIGCWIEMLVDAQAVHVSADIPVLGQTPRCLRHHPSQGD